ncbi:hypothetical protein Gohar_001641 [Gossypium harknessii]|uniref:Exostosin GT47 domain-containing protein n=1 Tax=Gossypium harknessii TaxID=34285 RepID=A0A7J9I7A3_9ROSI|nr:hypothetical protein [Gossypium harknessii]
MEGFRRSSTLVIVPTFLVSVIVLCLCLFSSMNPKNLSSTNFLSSFPTKQPSLLSATSGRDVVSHVKRVSNVEAGLAKARAAIREAIRTKSYTSDSEETFVPRGSVYRNPYGFHQSHIEMVKRFKIWIYKEGERPLVHNGPMKNIYAIEGQFIDEIESRKSPFKAQDPNEAHVLFLPISVGHIVKYIYMPITTYDRDRLVRIFTDYIKVVSHKYPFWNRTNGADHFMLSCHDWAPDVSMKDPQLYRNLIKVLCNANSSEGFHPNRDVTLPEIKVPPQGFSSERRFIQPPENRTILAFFAGGGHGNIRKILLHHWKDKDEEIQVHKYLPDGQDYNELMGKSKYCLCPSGFEVASPRVVESFYAGCVPVIISDSYVLPFSDVLDWREFSVKIAPEKITEIKRILEGIPEKEYRKMQKGVVKLRRHFELNRPAKPFDILHMVLHSIWLRRLNTLLL